MSYIVLSAEEREMVTQCALKFLERSYGRTNMNAGDLSRDDDRRQKIDAAGAEYVVAKLLGETWNKMANGQGGVDVGRDVEVRQTDLESGRLIIRSRDHDERDYYLAVGTLEGGYRIAGWMNCAEAKEHDEWIDNPNDHRPSWFVPQDQLRPAKARRKMAVVEMWTDGSSDGKSGGVGGWGVILKAGDKIKELSGQAEGATNNRMELTAAIEGLKALTRPCSVRLYSDSAYVVNSMTDGWIKRWERTGWMNSGKEPVKNRDLWQDLVEAMERHEVEWVHVRGHADDEMNNRADALAVAARGGATPAPPTEMASEATERPSHACIHQIETHECHVCSGRLRRAIEADVPTHELVRHFMENEAWLPKELRDDE